jgi:hypothetical protein
MNTGFMKNNLITALLVILLAVPFVLGGCDSVSPAQKGFAIYLTRENTPPSQMEILSRIAIAETPLISNDDIVSYTWDTHEIKLTPEAFQRLQALQVPTTGVSFVICVDDSPLYWGAFWAGYSSQSFTGVTIMVKPSLAENTIEISLGYPGANFYKGEDPRGETRIKDALQKAGKLK